MDKKLTYVSDIFQKSDKKQSEMIDLNNELQEKNRESLLNSYDKIKDERRNLMRRNRFLSIALIEYCRRKEIKSSFDQLISENKIECARRYNESLEAMKRLMLQSEFLDEIMKNETEKIKIELDVAKSNKNQVLNDFHASVQNAIEILEMTFSKQRFISRLVKRFEKIQTEVSTSRLELIKIQNLLLSLNEFEKQLDECNVADYENLQTNLQTISLKINSRNDLLKRLKFQYNNNIRRGKICHKKLCKVHEKCERLRKKYDDKKVSDIILQFKCKQLRYKENTLKSQMKIFFEKIQILSNEKVFEKYSEIQATFEIYMRELYDIREEN